MSVVDAVTRDLAKLAERLPGIENGTLAQAALEIAAGLDDRHNSLTSRTMANKELRETMAELAALVPAEKERTRLDALRDGRSLRLVGGAAGQD